MSNFVELSIAKAINAGLRKAMQEDEKVILFGEDVAQLGGVFRVTEGIHAEFGDSRIFNSPIAESGIVGTAIGLAMRGYRPVAEIQFDGFIFPAFNQITTQLAKMQNRSEGYTPMPVVIRVPYGGGIGAVEHHSESPEAYFAHTAGLRVITPSNPNDAYWMIQQAIKSNDPVMFFEPKRRYWQKGPVNLDEPPMGPHQARVLLEGPHVTIATYGPMTAVALQAAEIAASMAFPPRFNMSIAVCDGERLWQHESAGAALSSTTLIPALLQMLDVAGLRLSKIHLSSALRVKPDAVGRAAQRLEHVAAPQPFEAALDVKSLEGQRDFRRLDRRARIRGEV